MGISHYQKIMVGHGVLVILVGAMSGFMLTFSLLGEIGLSPLPRVIDVHVPGAVRAWRGAHVGNMLNGVLILALAAGMGYVSLSDSGQKFTCWGMVGVVWGNALFYVFAVFAPNRGLSFTDTRYGEASIAGVLAYLPALIAAVLLIMVCVVVVRAAFGGGKRE